MNASSVPDAAFDLQDDLVPPIVSTVADHMGFYPEHGRDAPDQGSLRSQPLRGGAAQLRALPARQRRGTRYLRTALERAVALRPGYADGWAMLSLIYKEEFTHRFNLLPDPLGRALAAAQRAVETAPSNHLAFHALASVEFFRKNHDHSRSQRRVLWL